MYVIAHNIKKINKSNKNITSVINNYNVVKIIPLYLQIKENIYIFAKK